MLHILLGLISLLLLLLQIVRHAGIRLRLSVGIRLRIARGTGRQSAVALIPGELGQAIVHLLAQVIVHILQIAARRREPANPRGNLPAGC